MKNKIVVDKHSETSGYYEEVFKIISEEIVEEQNINVDSVSGATVSSRGMINAVKDAVSKSIKVNKVQVVLKMKLTLLKNKILVVAIFIMIIFITSCSNNENKTFLLEIQDGTTFYSVGQSHILELDSVVEFPVVIRSSGNKPVETKFTGIELIKLFDSLNINLSGKNKITLNALDGYMVILDIKEIYEPNNVYLVLKRDGEYLESQKQGGSGPYQIVIRHDPFSQRWCKHVGEIIIE